MSDLVEGPWRLVRGMSGGHFVSVGPEDTRRRGDMPEAERLAAIENHTMVMVFCRLKDREAIAFLVARSADLAKLVQDALDTGIDEVWKVRARVVLNQVAHGNDATFASQSH